MRVPPRQAFCDTSFFYAALDEHDASCGDAVRLLEFCARHRVLFVSTWDVVMETVALLRPRSGYRLAIAFLLELDSGIQSPGPFLSRGRCLSLECGCINP